LRRIIKKLIDEKDGEVFLITRYSMSCGAFILNSLRDFNICFDFEAEHQGLIQLRLTDSTNELLLDFYGENDERTLEVEVIGEDWLKVFDVGSL